MIEQFSLSIVPLSEASRQGVFPVAAASDAPWCPPEGGVIYHA
jgi:hypothetical protein